MRQSLAMEGHALCRGLRQTRRSASLQQGHLPEKTDALLMYFYFFIAKTVVNAIFNMTKVLIFKGKYVILYFNRLRHLRRSR